MLSEGEFFELLSESSVLEIQEIDPTQYFVEDLESEILEILERNGEKVNLQCIKMGKMGDLFYKVL